MTAATNFALPPPSLSLDPSPGRAQYVALKGAVNAAEIDRQWNAPAAW
jgi:hypothetical protein